MSGSLSRILAFSFLLLAVPAAAQDWIYTVVANDSLIGFSNQYLKQPHYWKQLQKINQIEDPQHLLPGTRLRVPLQWVKQGPVPADIEKVTGEAWLWRAGGRCR